MSKRIAVTVLITGILAGCSLLTDLSGLDTGSSPADGGREGTTTTALPDGSASSSSSSTSSSSGSSSSSSTSGAPSGDAAPDSPSDGCTVTTTDARSPSKAAATNSGAPWSQFDSVLTENSLGAMTSLTGTSERSMTLVLASFGFAIPATASIRGVEVTVRARATASTQPKDVRDESVRLAPNGNIAGLSLKGGQDQWASDYTTHSAGGPTATWGLALTPAIVNDASFGVGYVARFQANMGESATLDVDVVKVAITYCD